MAAALATAVGTSTSANKAPPGPPCFGRSFTAKQSRPFIDRVWDTRHWSRGSPSHKALEAWHKRLQCPAGPGHLKALRHRWRASQRQFYDHRQKMLFRIRITPFYCSDSEMTFDGGWYAIPCANVNAESGGRGGWTCNTYGVIDPTWFDYGGPLGGACGNSEREQSLIAHVIYEDVGTAAWTPFEG